MKKHEVCEGQVIRTDFPAVGIVESDGLQVSVKNALPGQRVRFQITKIRGDHAEGRLLEVTQPSPLEQREGICVHSGACGGCVYQTLPYQDQLRLKVDQVRRILTPVLGDVPMEPAAASPAEHGYRNKMEYSFGNETKDGPLTLGLHKKNSMMDIINADGCQIADEDFGRILSATRDYFDQERTSFYHKVRHGGYLRYLLVRKGSRTGEILVSLVTSSQTGSASETTLLEGWRDVLLSLSLDGHLTGILHTTDDSLADVVRDDATEILYGQDYFHEEILGMKFRISPFSFFQTNSAGAELLYEKVREYAEDTKGKLIYDLYCGTGTITQILAPVAGHVVGVEIVPEAVEAARENAAANGLTDCTFIAGDVLKVLDELTQKPDVIVLDPPRDGIHPKALPKIIGYGVDRIIYVSCKPTSLARDLPSFLQAGYEARRVSCVDMFPDTANIETVCLLIKTQNKGD